MAKDTDLATTLERLRFSRATPLAKAREPETALVQDDAATIFDVARPLQERLFRKAELLDETGCRPDRRVLGRVA